MRRVSAGGQVSDTLLPEPIVQSLWIFLGLRPARARVGMARARQRCVLVQGPNIFEPEAPWLVTFPG
jgi:hypothetical protein